MVWHGKSLRARLTAVFTALIGVLFAFGVLIFVAFERRNQELLYNALYETIIVFARSIERELSAVELLSVDVLSDETVQARFAALDASTPGFEWHEVSDQLARRFATHTRLAYVLAIVGIDRGGRTTFSRSDFPLLQAILDPSLVEGFRASDESRRWIITDDGDPRLFYLRRVREIKDFALTELGTIVVVVDKERLARAAVSTPFRDDMQVAVMSGDRAVFLDGETVGEIARSTRGIIGTSGYRVVRFDGSELFVASVFDPTRDLSFVFVVPYELLFSGLSRFNTLLTILAGGVLVAFIAISFWIARDISAPIVELAQRMRIVEEADFPDVDLGANSYERPDEIGTLYREFGVMLRRIDTLITENYRTELAMKDTRFRSLQAQINPHFLYNTLESINWIAQLHDQEEISTMVQALGTLLRASIDSRRQAVTIAEELELLSQYVLIQQHRYGERLRFAIDVPTECCAYGIPSLTLQPLVENSLKYGLERRSAPCTITVSGRLERASVALSVTDDGPGMSEKFVAAIEAGRVEPSGSGVGIKNIRERLHALFGSDGRLTIGSRLEAGTTITIEIPRISDGELRKRIKDEPQETHTDR